MKRRILQNVVGITAVVLLVLLVALVFFKSKQPAEEKTTTPKSAGTITFENEELVFDGSGKLDLMQGVTATDSEGKDVTDKVVAMITADSTLNRKTVRYTLADDIGETVSQKRTLVMKDYSGPSLEVKNKLTIKADDLKDLINVLKKDERLKAEDGYGRDITTQVKCIREKQANGQYTMKFSVVNAYEDAKEVSVSAYIEGDVRDPEIRLSTKEVTLRKTEYFDEMKYVIFASDGSTGNATGKIQTESSVDASKPGDYRVVYRLYSADKTAITTEVLKVTVIGE